MKNLFEEEKELLTHYQAINDRGKYKLIQIARVFAATDTFSADTYKSASAELRKQIAALEEEYEAILRHSP